jgi:hypothetical protein
MSGFKLIRMMLFVGASACFCRSPLLNMNIQRATRQDLGT